MLMFFFLNWRLIINDCLDSGTQLPFIREGIKEGYGIIVMNPNLNQIHVDGKKISIRVSNLLHYKLEKCTVTSYSKIN